jgi:hypothetical protein
MQLSEKSKENFDTSSEGPNVERPLRSKRQNSPWIFQVIASLSIRNFTVWLPAWNRKENIHGQSPTMMRLHL